MRNDSALKLLENTLIPKPLTASKKTLVFWFFLKYVGFSFLTVTKTALHYEVMYDNFPNVNVIHF